MNSKYRHVVHCAHEILLVTSTYPRQIANLTCVTKPCHTIEDKDLNPINRNDINYLHLLHRPAYCVYSVSSIKYPYNLLIGFIYCFCGCACTQVWLQCRSNHLVKLYRRILFSGFRLKSE